MFKLFQLRRDNTLKMRIVRKNGHIYGQKSRSARHNFTILLVRSFHFFLKYYFLLSIYHREPLNKDS